MFYHEYGHAYDYNYPEVSLSNMKDVIELYHSWGKWFRSNKEYLLSSIEEYTELVTDEDFSNATEQRAILSDLFQTYFGDYGPYGGHNFGYYNSNYKRIVEFIAHANVSSWFGNDCINKIVPGLNEDMIKLMKNYNKRI